MDTLSKNFGTLTMSLVVLLAISFSALPALGQYGGGSGTAGDPYLINTAGQMNAIGANQGDWDKHFLMTANINLSAYTGTSFNIIGTNWENFFTGVFDGNGHTISNFNYTTTGEPFIGLFRAVSGSNAEIKDLGLINPNVDAGTGRQVGSLVAHLGMFPEEGTVTNCYVEGGSVSGGWYVGGLVGVSTGTITNCHSTGSVLGTVRGVGGLVGLNYFNSTMTNCYSTASVSGNNVVGGLVGGNGKSISGTGDGITINCYAAGSVSGVQNVGGLVGYNYKSIVRNSYSTGIVSGTTDVGGLVGSNQGTVSSSFWDTQTSGQSNSEGGTGKTTAEIQTASTFIGWNGCGELVWTIDEGNDYPRLGWENLPGQPLPTENLSDFVAGAGTEQDPYLIETGEQLNLIGLFYCEFDKHFKLMANIDLSAYTGTSFNIIGTDTTQFTGAFDGNDHTISNFTYSSTRGWQIGLFGVVGGPNAEIKDLGLINPNVDAGTGPQVGPLVAVLREEGTVTNCYTEGGSVSGDDDVGGLVGDNGGTITNCYSTSSVSGDDYVGGLVGRNDDGMVTNCYSTGSVSGDYVGGLVGRNVSGGTINNCYSTGSVSGDFIVGGLVGLNYYGMVSNCYAAGNVSGTGSEVGGLVGSNYYGMVSNCYAAGNVSGTGSEVGGLVGWNEGTVSSSFWDIQTSGLTNMCGFVRGSGCDDDNGKTTGQMQTESTFTSAGWDFANVWDIDEGKSYPKFQWDYHPVGDFDLDKDVDLPDFGIFSAAWLSTPADPNSWNPVCDLYDPNETPPYPEYVLDPNDVIIDVLDLEIFSEHWLEGTAE